MEDLQKEQRNSNLLSFIGIHYQQEILNALLHDSSLCYHSGSLQSDKPQTTIQITMRHFFVIIDYHQSSTPLLSQHLCASET